MKGTKDRRRWGGGLFDLGKQLQKASGLRTRNTVYEMAKAGKGDIHTMATELGVGVTCIHKHLRALEAVGVVAWDRRKGVVRAVVRDS